MGGCEGGHERERGILGICADVWYTLQKGAKQFSGVMPRSLKNLSVNAVEVIQGTKSGPPKILRHCFIHQVLTLAGCYFRPVFK